MVEINTVEGQQTPAQWFQSLPIVTQYWLGATVVLTLSGNFGVISVNYYAWVWDMISQRFELWRVLTCFCYAGPFSLGMLFLIYMLYTMSVRYESGSPFNTGGGGGTADYVFMLLFGMTFCLCTFPFLRATFRMGPFFLTQMVYYVMYVWSKRNPTAQSSIWGVPVPAIWLPFAYLALLVLTGSPYFDALHGMGMGHIYYFLVDVVPQVYGRDILVTPNFLIDQIGVGQYQRERPLQDRSDARPGTVGPAPPDNGGHQWGGAGRALGRQ